MSAAEMIVASLADRRDNLTEALRSNRDAFTPFGIASLEQQITDLDDEIARTIGAQR
jgi:hypothetical protein